MITKTMYEMIPTWKKVENVFMDHDIKDADSIKRILKDVFKDRPEQEHLIVLHLDANCEIKGYEKVFVGNLISSVATAREVFRSAIACGDFAIALAHNHPGGNLTPSQADIMSTRALCSVGHAVGIPVVEHFICDSEMELTPLKLTDKYLAMFHSKVKFKGEENSEEDLIPMNEHPSETFVTKKTEEEPICSETVIKKIELKSTWVGNSGPDDYKDFKATVIFSQEYNTEELNKIVGDGLIGCVDDCYTVEEAIIKFNEELGKFITYLIGNGIKIENFFINEAENGDIVTDETKTAIVEEEIVLASIEHQDICKQISTMDRFTNFFEYLTPSNGSWCVNEETFIAKEFQDRYYDGESTVEVYISPLCKETSNFSNLNKVVFIFDRCDDVTVDSDFTVYYDNYGNVYMIWFHED